MRTLLATILILTNLAMPASVFVAAQTMTASTTSVAVSTHRANYYLKEVLPQDYPALATYDLLILPAEVQVYNPTAIPALRVLNPDIIILAYVPTVSFNTAKWHDSLHAGLLAQIKPQWWMTDAAGEPLSIWPGTKAIAITSDWQYTLPAYVHKNIMVTGLWDGVFYDEFSAEAPAGASAPIAAAWKFAATNLVSYTRELLGPHAIIITNGDSDPAFTPFVNGRMFENFPTPWQGEGTWADSMTPYLTANKKTSSLFVLNGTTGDTGDYTDKRNARFTLTSALLGDGFFSYDFGLTDHGQLEHIIPEELINLGKPIAKLENIFSPGKSVITNDIYLRKYERGTVFVNATDKPRTFGLVKGKYKDINGAPVNTLTLEAHDGAMLMLRNPITK